MMPKHTASLLKQSVTAALNDSAEVLRRAEVQRGERSNQGGLFGQATVYAQVQTVYDEYKRRTELILDCIRKVLHESSFRYYGKLNKDLQCFFLDQCGIHSGDIDAKLKELPSGGKPNYSEFKAQLHQKLLAEVALCAEGYLTHHNEVIHSWWVASGKTFFWWLFGSIGTIIVALLIAWLTKKYI